MSRIIYAIFFAVVAICIGMLIVIAVVAMYEKLKEVYYSKTLRYEKNIYNSEIIEKDRVEYTGIEAIIFENEYNLYLICKSGRFCINDKKIFEKYEEGESLNILVAEGYDKRGQLKDLNISVIES